MRIMTKSKVFCIGLPRSGTSTLNEALLILGYKSVHNPIKYISQKWVGEFNFEGEWDAITNFGEHFYPQLDKMFPESKFILTVRNKEKWLESCRWKYKLAPSTNLDKINRVSIFGCYKFDELSFSITYDSHFKGCLDYFSNRPNQFLILYLDQGDGWRKLCDFLGDPVPETPFPHKNSKPEIIERKDSENKLKAGYRKYIYEPIQSRALLGDSFAQKLLNFLKT